MRPGNTTSTYVYCIKSKDDQHDSSTPHSKTIVHTKKAGRPRKSLDTPTRFGSSNILELLSKEPKDTQWLHIQQALTHMNVSNRLLPIASSLADWS